MTLNLAKIKIVNWIWVFYPVIVIVFIIYTLNLLMGSGPTSLLELLAKQTQTETESVTVSQLKDKLQKLKAINKEEATNDLKRLTAMLPTSKKVWYLLNAVGRSASDAGAKVNQYKGIVGNVKEASQSAAVTKDKAKKPTVDTLENLLSFSVEYKSMPYDSLVKILGDFENYLPLVKVNSAAYGNGRVYVVVEAGWSPLLDLGKTNSMKVPEYKNAVETIFAQTATMQNLTETSE